MKRAELVASAVSALFFAAMFYEAAGLRGQGRSGEMGSGTWPMMALGACLVLSVAWLVSGLLERRRVRAGPAAPLDPAEARARQRTVAVSAVLFLAYIVALPWIGFILATLVFVLAFVFGLGERRLTVLTVSPALLTALMVLVFARFITMPLPRGAGIFAGFSRLFY